MDNIKKKLQENELFQSLVASAKDGVILIQADTLEKEFGDDDKLPQGEKWTREGFGSADINASWFPDLSQKEGQENLLENLQVWLKEDFEEHASEAQKKELKKISNEIKSIDTQNVLSLISKISDAHKKHPKDQLMDKGWKDTKRILLSDDNKVFSRDLKNVLENLEGNPDLEWYVWEVCPIKEYWESWAWSVDTMHCYRQEMASRRQGGSYPSSSEYEKRLKNISLEDVREKLKLDGYINVGSLWISSHDPTVMVSEIETDLPDGYSNKGLVRVLNAWLADVAKVKCKAEYRLNF